MPKFSIDERRQLKNIVASLSITRLLDGEIVKEIKKQTGKSISLKQIYNIRQQIKRDSFDWYKNLQQAKYEYLHEFKERINEVIWVQKKHNEIIKNNQDNPQIQQTSLAELHKLNITLANYFDVAPDIINNGSSISTTSENKKPERKISPTEEIILV